MKNNPLAAWDRIHNWLRKNAPIGYGNLREGASESFIREAEETMGVRLPADLKMSIAVHDGQSADTALIGGEGWMLLPLREIISIRDCWPQADLVYAHNIPIAWNRAHDYVLLRLDQPAMESALMIQRADRIDPDPLAWSCAAWLAHFADELEDGMFTFSNEHGEVMLVEDIE